MDKQLIIFMKRLDGIIFPSGNLMYFIWWDFRLLEHINKTVGAVIYDKMKMEKEILNEKN